MHLLKAFQLHCTEFTVPSPARCETCFSSIPAGWLTLTLLQAPQNVLGHLARLAVQYRSTDADFDERLRRVMGLKAEPSHVDRRVFVGGMPFYYDVSPIAHCEYIRR